MGEKYWGFQRNTVFVILREISIKDDLTDVAIGFKNVVKKIIDIEEYRGEDTAILLKEHHRFEKSKMGGFHPHADYDGTVVRFYAILWTYERLEK